MLAERSAPSMNPLKTLSSLIPPKSCWASPAPQALPPQSGLVACPPVGLSFEEVEQWQADLRQRLERLRQNAEANQGHSEELIRQRRAWSYSAGSSNATCRPWQTR